MPSKTWDVMNDLEMTTAKICSAREIIDAAVDRLQEHQYDKAEVMITAAYEFLEYYLNEFDEKFKLAWQETVVKQKKEEDDAWDAVNREKEYYEPSMPPWGHSDLEYGVHYSGSTVSSCDKDDPSPECKGAWNSFWEEKNYPEEYGLQYTDEEITAMCDAAKKVEQERLKKELLDAKINAKSSFNDGLTREYYQDRVNKLEDKLGVVKGDKVKKWVLPVEQNEDDYFVSFPDDLLEAANLKEGDQVYWVDNKDGTYTIRKVTKPLGMNEC